MSTTINWDKIVSELGSGSPQPVLARTGNGRRQKPHEVDLDFLTGETKTDDWDNDETPSPTMARLVYLLIEHQIVLPQVVAQLLPFGRQLKELYKGISYGGDLDDLAPIYREGARYGKGSIGELMQVIQQLAEPKLMSMDPGKRIPALQALLSLEGAAASPFESNFEEVDMDEVIDGEEIPKFKTGFAPLDIVTGGFYNGLVVLLGEPGVGKTSIMLTMAGELVMQGIPVEFFENEIPARMMRPRMATYLKRYPALRDKKLFRLFCGPYTAQEIVSDTARRKNPDRVIMFDSPDVLISPGGERREVLELAYQYLIGAKPNNLMVVVPSQPRRSDGALSMRSVAESWAKAWYADIMIALMSAGRGSILAQTVKNRFGKNNEKMFFDYDPVDCSWGVGAQDWEDDDW